VCFVGFILSGRGLRFGPFNLCPFNLCPFNFCPFNFCPFNFCPMADSSTIG